MTEAAIITRAAPRAATSWNATDGTFEVVLSTGAAVKRTDARGTYDEILSLSAEGLPDRIPLLDSHSRGSIDARLGHVEDIRVVGGEMIGRAVLSRHNPRSQRVAAELSDGQTFGVSIGYVVRNQTERTNPDTKRREKVSAFALIEASLVSLPADVHAGIRSMTDATPAAAPDNNQTAVADRAAVNAEIRSLARVANLDQAFVDTQVDAGATIEQARAAAFDAMRTRSAAATTIRTTATVGVDHTDPEVRARAMGEALFHRVAPSHQPSEPARAYVGLTIPEMARDCLRTRGISTTSLSSGTIVERALQSTSDFPLLLADTVNRTLRQAYETAPAGVRLVGRQTTAKDFRAKHRLQFSTAPTLEPVNEHGEFKSGGMAEAQESYAVTTFGRIIGFTRQAMVNDDLGAFADVTRRMGQAAAAFEASFLANLVVSNPVMSDTKTLFNTAHGNVAASGAPISVTTLAAARQAMRSQTGLLGELINVTPKYLLVGADRETEAEQAVTQIQPVNVADVNPFVGRLQVVVDPRISGAWYLVADPAEVDGLEYSYLEGAAGPQITTDLGFTYDGVRFRVRLDFGGGFVDWRSWYRNPGV